MAYRTLMIDKEPWEFIVGKEGVKIRDPQGKCTWVRKHVLFGYTLEAFEAKCREFWFDADDDYCGEPFAVGPGDVRRHIEANLL